MHAKLPALEKNILKYRALQMVLLLHQVESLRTFVIDSIRATDSLPHGNSTKRLPIGTKRPMEKALGILVSERVITEEESVDLQSIIELRNKIGHMVHELVADISAPHILRQHDLIYDYFALNRFEKYRYKIMKGMSERFILALSFRELIFEQAEAAYKQELVRLRKRIDRQYESRHRVTA
jgi:hypothetical protein